MRAVTARFAYAAACLFALALVPGSRAAHAQAHPSSRSDATNREIVDLEHRWVDAIVAKDITTLERVFAPTYVDTDEEGHRGNRQQTLAGIKSPDLKLQSIKLRDIHVQSYGDAAVATGTAAQDGSYKGQPVATRVVFTDTFVREGGTWRAVASQRTAPRP